MQSNRPKAIVVTTCAVLLVITGMLVINKGAWLVTLMQQSFTQLVKPFSQVAFSNSAVPSEREKIKVIGLKQIDEQLWQQWQESWPEHYGINEIREDLIAKTWIGSVDIIKRPEQDILIIIEENKPLAVQRVAGQHYLLFTDGRRAAISPVQARIDFADKQLVLGEINHDSQQEIDELYQLVPAEIGKIVAVRRINQRRWDLLLNDGMTILLPAENWQSTRTDLELLLAAGLRKYHRAGDLELLDLRVSHAAIIRLRQTRLVPVGTLS